MGNALTFSDILESADRLSLDEQETMVDVLNRRIIEYRRAELVKEIRDAQHEFEQDKCKPTTPSALMKEILS